MTMMFRTTITTQSRVKNIIIHPMMMIRMVSSINNTSSYLHTRKTTTCCMKGGAIVWTSMLPTTRMKVNTLYTTTLNNNCHFRCGGSSFHDAYNQSNIRNFSNSSSPVRHGTTRPITSSSSLLSISSNRITSSSNSQTKKLWYSTTNTIFNQQQQPPPQNTTTTTNTNTNMADEYSVTATMDEMSYGNTCTIPQLTLECGITLSQVQIRYRTYGISPQTTKEKSNVIVICHALTGNASIDTWWSSLLGPNQAFDTNQYHIICCNILGSCYGSTSPISINPNTLQPYGIDFPMITVQDTVRIQLICLQQYMKFQSIHCVIGGSFGGMQTLEYALQGNHITSTTKTSTQSSSSSPYIKSIIPIACNAQHSAWQIAISEIQRQMIYHDIQWSQYQQYHLATQGLQLARQMAMISYRTAMGYSHKFGRRCTTTPTIKTIHSETTNDDTDTTIVVPTEQVPQPPQWDVSKYLQYQGEKFVHQRQFDPITYVKLTQQMDSHDICRNRIIVNDDNNNTTTTNNEENVATVLQQITIPTLVLGIDSDLLYPISEQELLAKYIPNSKFHIIHSIEGHDGFLIEQQQVGTYIQQFLSSLCK